MIGFNQIDCNHSIYIYQCSNARIIMPIHVDDLLITSNSKSELAAVKSELAANFKIHNQGPTKSILSIKIEQDWLARSISLSQPGYIESILEQFSMMECNPVPIPMDPGQKLSTKMSPDTLEGRSAMSKYPYRELIGKLLYLAIATRPDIAYVISVLCCFIENPGMDHWNTAKQVLQYLKGTIKMWLVYSQQTAPDLFTTYSNADLSGNLDNS